MINRFKIIKYIAVILVVIFISITFFFNRSQPSHIETAEAIVLGEGLQKSIKNEKQEVFTAASRDVVTISAYGFVDEESQNILLVELKKILKSHPFYGKVNVVFFPAREYKVSIDGNRKVFELIKREQYKKIEIN